jgi:nucleotide-binding universal stress UspA family protein
MTKGNGFHKILVATDFSPASEPALKEASKLARNDGAELLIAYACEPASPLLIDGYVVPWVYEQWDDTLRKEAERALVSLVETARKEGINARSILLRGSPFQAIADAAGNEHADLVVMGTHGRTGFSRMVLGSVAARVAASAPCPVLTVRAA